MYLRKIYIRHREQYPDSPNTFAALDGFTQLGVEVQPYYGFDDIQALTDLGPEVGVTGFVGDTWAALKVLGKPMPIPIDYPEQLTPWLGRKIWRSTLGEIRRSVEQVFIKPVSEKLFTGFIWRSNMGDQIRMATCEDDTEIWVSEPISLESEYRCFIQDGDIVGVRHYKGDWGKAIDRRTVEAAVSAYKDCPRAFSLDFGVTSTGQTVLVEVNDGYALGSYGLPSIIYAKFIEARWEELTR